MVIVGGGSAGARLMGGWELGRYWPAVMEELR